MNRLIPILLLVVLLFPVQAAAAPTQAVIPTFSILNVVQDTEVTIKTFNFRADDTYNVLMGKIGTRGIGGYLVTTQDSGAGGTFTATYSIPAALHGDEMIAIRLESPFTGYYSYNWFYNNDGNVAPSSGGSLPAGVIPTFSIQSVDEDNEVTIKTKNFPADDEFIVTMGKIGTRGIGGAAVGTQDSGAGGSFTATYSIPASLHGLYQIAIRLESPTSGYYAYNWFYNNDDAPSPGGGPSLPAGVIPTFSIKAVDEDTSVTITPKNFTANDTYTVRMGAFGTRGVGGIVVDTVTTDGSGDLDKVTYSIPAALHGSYRIAIRLESNISGYYSYNWFYNNDAP